jgi:hypothetical protein
MSSIVFPTKITIDKPAKITLLMALDIEIIENRHIPAFENCAS